MRTVGTDRWHVNVWGDGCDLGCIVFRHQSVAEAAARALFNDVPQVVHVRVLQNGINIVLSYARPMSPAA